MELGLCRVAIRQHGHHLAGGKMAVDLCHLCHDRGPTCRWPFPRTLHHHGLARKDLTGSLHETHQPLGLSARPCLLAAETNLRFRDRKNPLTGMLTRGADHIEVECGPVEAHISTFMEGPTTKVGQVPFYVPQCSRDVSVYRSQCSFATRSRICGRLQGSKLRLELILEKIGRAGKEGAPRTRNMEGVDGALWLKSLGSLQNAPTELFLTNPRRKRLEVDYRISVDNGDDDWVTQYSWLWVLVSGPMVQN